MKKTFKKVIASVMAVTTMAVSALSMNANAYWVTKRIDNSNNQTIGEAYLAVSTTSVYATTSRYSSNHSMSVYINYAYGNHDVSRDKGGYSNPNKIFVQWWGTNFTKAKSTHTVNGYSVPIIMGSES